MRHVHLATGLAIRGDWPERSLLMVASRYANHAEPLWNLPGGRQLPGELLTETVAREVFEETRLRVEAREVAYVSESYDGDVHFLNVTFNVVLRQAQDDTGAQNDTKEAVVLRRAQDDRDHVVEVAWVPLSDVGKRIVVGVVREPLLAYINGSLSQRYAGFHDAGITIEWPADSQ